MPCSAADFCEIQLGQLLAGQGLNSSTESGFHNAACSAEDHACAGAKAQGLVKLLIRQVQEADTRLS